MAEPQNLAIQSFTYTISCFHNSHGQESDQNEPLKGRQSEYGPLL